MIDLTFEAILPLYDRIVEAIGGTAGLRNRAGLEPALAQPRMTFSGVALYADLESEASALAYPLIRSHSLVDGNERTGFAAIGAFLRPERYQIVAMAEFP